MANKFKKIDVEIMLNSLRLEISKLKAKQEMLEDIKLSYDWEEDNK